MQAELTRVLVKKFGLANSEAAELIAPLLEVFVKVHPRVVLNICRDEADNRVLECAVDGRADCIVTGDRDLLSLLPLEELLILTPREYLDRFDELESRQVR